MSKRLSAVLVAIACLAVAACGDDSPTSSGSATTGGSGGDVIDLPENSRQGFTDGAVRIGWIGDATGPTACCSGFQGKGVAAATEYLNQNGGILGRQVELLTEDVQFNAELAPTAYSALVDDRGILVLLDLGGSSTAVPLLAPVERDGIPVLGPAHTLDEVLPVPNLYSMFPHYGNQADSMVISLEERVDGPLRVAMVVTEVQSAPDIIEHMRRSVGERGGEYVGDVGINVESPNFADAATATIDLIRSSDANAIGLHGGSSHALGIITELVSRGVDLPMAGIAGVADATIWTEGPPEAVDLVEAAHATLPAVLDCAMCSEIRDFTAGTQWESDITSPFFSLGWLQVMMVNEAAERAAEADGEVNWETVNAALRAAPFDTGDITCAMDFTSGNYSGCSLMFRWDEDHLSPTKSAEEWAELNTYLPEQTEW